MVENGAHFVYFVEIQRQKITCTELFKQSHNAVKSRITTFHDFRAIQLSPPNFRTPLSLLISDYPLPTFDYSLPPTHLRLHTSDVRRPSSHFPLPIFNFRFPTCDFLLPTTHFRLLIYNVRLPTSDYPFPTSHFSLTIFHFYLFTSLNPHPTSLLLQRNDVRYVGSASRIRDTLI